MNIKELQEKIGKIVQKAIEGQMDWNAYYQGSWEEPTEEIFDLVNEYVHEKVDAENYYKFLEDESLPNKEVGELL